MDIPSGDPEGARDHGPPPSGGSGADTSQGPGGPAAPDGPAGSSPRSGPLDRLARGAWQVVLVGGIAALVLGVLVLAWPGASLRVAGVLFGIYLLLAGVAQVVAAFGAHLAAAMRTMAFLSGAVSILLGLFCFRGVLESILLLALWIGIGWLFRGITQTAAAAGAPPGTPARGWHVFLGVLSALAGIVLMVSPLASVTVLTLLAGWWLVAVGAVEIATALRIRHHLHHPARGG